jgi:hypothetical protein
MSYSAAQGVVRSSGRRIPWAIVFGAVLALGGLALVVYAVSTRDDSPLFMIGGIVVGAGVLRLTTALSADARRRRHPVDPDDPRWRDGVAPMQLAGRTCVECGRKIIIGSDALSCEQCSQPAHVDCRGAHHARAHGEVRFERPGA